MATTNSPRTAPTPKPLGRTPQGATPSAAKAAQPKPSRLGAVRRGLLREAKRFFFYGPPGVGKSSLALDSGAIFFDVDRGSGHLDLPRYTFRDADDGHIPESLEEVYAGIDDLLAAPHEWRAVAIDTVDALESLVWKHVCAGKMTKGGDKIESIEDFGYGKGYNIAADEWRRLLHRLDLLRIKRGMHIILVGHELVKTFKNPLGDDYDRYLPKLHERSLGILREWCEVIGLVAFDDVVKKAAGGRARGVSTGYRMVYLEHNAAWDAKSRLPLPAQIELQLERPWAPFAAAVEALYTQASDLRAKIDTELARLGAAFVRGDGHETNADDVRAAVAAAGDDVAVLSKYLVVLQQSQNKETNP